MPRSTARPVFCLLLVVALVSAYLFLRPPASASRPSNAPAVKPKQKFQHGRLSAPIALRAEHRGNMAALPVGRKAKSRIVAHGDDVAWKDISTVRYAANLHQAQGVVAPVFMTHLQRYRAPEPFRTVHTVSSWVDFRPTMANRGAHVTLIGTANADATGGDSRDLEKATLHCFVVATPKQHPRKGEEQEVRTLVLKAKATALEERNLGLGEEDFTVQWDCVLPQLDDERSWLDYEIYTSLSLPSIPPPPETFLPSTSIPLPSIEAHAAGEGPATLCLPPLRGDLYAPFMRDYLAYYRALGFSKFFVYLLNPGIESLSVLRELMDDFDDVEAVRWATSLAWQKETIKGEAKMRKDYLVEPGLWNIDGVEKLPREVEANFGTMDGDYSLTTWYYGQNLVQNDCNNRALLAGSRWVSFLDWDEHLLLVPPGGRWPPRSDLGNPANVSRISLFAKEVKGHPTWTPTLWDDSINRLRMKELPASPKSEYPAAIMMQNSFLHSGYDAGRVPSGIEEVMEKSGLKKGWEKPSLDVPFYLNSAARDDHWFPPEQRSKYILDPWAWWSIRVHLPGRGYPEFMASRGFCVPTVRTGRVPRIEEAECVQTFWDLYGTSTLVLPTPSSSEVRARDPSKITSGGIMHLRVDGTVSGIVRRLQKTVANQTSTASKPGSPPVRTLAELWGRTPLSDWQEEAASIIDWSIPQVMEDVIPEMLGEFRRPSVRRSKGGARTGMGHSFTSFAFLSVLIIGFFVIRGRKRRGALTGGMRYSKM